MDLNYLLMRPSLTLGSYDPAKKGFQIVRWRVFFNTVCIVVNTIAGSKVILIILYQDSILYLNETYMVAGNAEKCKYDELSSLFDNSAIAKLISFTSSFSSVCVYSSLLLGQPLLEMAQNQRGSTRDQVLEFYVY